MNTGPVLVKDPDTRLVRLWDSGWQMCHILPVDMITDTEPAGTGRKIIVTEQHVVAQWLQQQWYETGDTIYLTDERAGDAWIGRLHGWWISKTGPCPQCEHCQQIILTAVFHTQGVQGGDR